MVIRKRFWVLGFWVFGRAGGQETLLEGTGYRGFEEDGENED